MGSFVAPMPAGSLNVALSNYAKEFRNNALVGDLVAPRVPVARQSFQYVVWNRDDLRLPGGVAGAIVRAPGNRPMGVRRSYSTSPYMCVSHALETKVPFESEAYGLGLGFSTKQALTKQLINQINLDREVAIANSILNLTNFPNGTTLSGGSMWDNYGGASHPIAVVEGFKAELRQAGVQDSDMVLILSDPVRVALSNHPDLIERFKYTNISGAITMQQMESVFGVKCVQASAIWIDKGNNASYAWGTSAVLAYAHAAPTQEDVSCMKTFTWVGGEGIPGPPGAVDGFGVLEFPDPYLSAKTDYVSCDWYYGIVPTATETAIPILNAVQAPTMVTIPQDTEG